MRLMTSPFRLVMVSPGTSGPRSTFLRPRLPWSPSASFQGPPVSPWIPLYLNHLVWAGLQVIPKPLSLHVEGFFNLAHMTTYWFAE
jgi:hypothetical protein